MTIYNTPVCIVGAGPAGSTASLFLSKYGIPHILTDRQSFPRDKVCGEQFSGRVGHVLRELNPQWEAEMVAQDILFQSRYLYWSLQPENKSSLLHFNEKSTPILKAKRTLFDNFLFQKAKASPFATCLENVYLTHFDRNTDQSQENHKGVVIKDKSGKIQINAQLVLFCTGEKTHFLKKIFGPQYKDKGDEVLLLRRYYRPDKPNNSNNFTTEVYLVLHPIPHIVLINPISNWLTMVELGVLKSATRQYDGRLDSLFDLSLGNIVNLQGRFTPDNLAEKTKGNSMLLGVNPRLMSAEGMLLVGSAIGSIHPITGYGVGHAMRSAQLAAFWAAESIKKQDYSADFLKQYDENIKKRMKMDFQAGRFVHWSLKNLWFLLPIMRVMIVSQRFSKLVTSPNFNRNALNPFFYLKLWLLK